MADATTVVEGKVKYREGKKWKSRWCVLKKPSPVAAVSLTCPMIQVTVGTVTAVRGSYKDTVRCLVMLVMISVTFLVLWAEFRLSQCSMAASLLRHGKAEPLLTLQRMALERSRNGIFGSRSHRLCAGAANHEQKMKRSEAWRDSQGYSAAVQIQAQLSDAPSFWPLISNPLKRGDETACSRIVIVPSRARTPCVWPPREWLYGVGELPAMISADRWHCWNENILYLPLVRAREWRDVPRARCN
ncbi:hypothetical protein BaRGS_00001363 [Batillaria attramentaria]|uniref:PH domain-containing protein n=1 Tax=Batillaria attramentaria TaxID=370345 RepID=A0ABD0M6N6_9CAEN